MSIKPNEQELMPETGHDQPAIPAKPFVLKGDFATGERTLSPTKDGPDFARGGRTLSPTKDEPDFARGGRTLPPTPDGPDFARGERTLPPAPENKPLRKDR